MSPEVVVPALRIQAVSGPTLYPDEGGYSHVWGEVESHDAALTTSLDQMLHSGTVASLRCGLLGVAGTLDRREVKEGICHYRVRIQSARYGIGSTPDLPPNTSFERTRES
jgi:hypothetical protein